MLNKTLAEWTIRSTLTGKYQTFNLLSESIIKQTNRVSQRCSYEKGDLKTGSKFSTYFKFKGSVRYNQKWLPTLVAQVDLTFQNWWEFKVLATNDLNTPLKCLIFSRRFLRISGNGRSKSSDNFYPFFFW